MSNSEQQAREQILNLVADYYNRFLKKDNDSFTEGDRIPYSGRVF
nr:hypothetical protein [Butyrivibrio sp. AE3003]